MRIASINIFTKKETPPWKKVLPHYSADELPTVRTIPSDPKYSFQYLQYHLMILLQLKQEATDANKMSFRIEPTQMLQRMRDGSTDKKPSPSPSVALNNYYAYEEPTTHGERSYDTSIRKDRSRRPRRRRSATIGLGRFSYQEQEEDRRTQRLVSSSSDEL